MICAAQLFKDIMYYRLLNHKIRTDLNPQFRSSAQFEVRICIGILLYPEKIKCLRLDHVSHYLAISSLRQSQHEINMIAMNKISY